MKSGLAMLLALALGGSPATVVSQREEALSKDYEAVDGNKPVVCLLPGRVRKLGSMMTYLERRKPVEVTASECEIRGGEYTLYDRANYENALAVWREAADQGDATAQIYVGEIYEKGWVEKPDHATAALWYHKAAEQGDRRAQRRLAYFYENGLGVERDRERALVLWRSALDLREDLVLASEVEEAKSEAQKQIAALVAQLEQQNMQTGRLQRSLDEVRNLLASERQALQRERMSAKELGQDLARARQTSGDPDRVRDLEGQLSAGQSRIDEQQVAIELLQAEVDSQKAQVSASMRQADVRGRQLARVQKELLAEAVRGDALLLELNEKNRDLDSLEKELATAEAQLAQSRGTQEQLSLQLAESTGDAEEAASLQRKLQLAERDVRARESQIQALRKETQQERDLFQQQLAASQLRETELSSALEASKREREKLSRSLQETAGKLERMEADLTRARYAVADREAAAEYLREQLHALGTSDEQQRKDLGEKLRQAEQTIAVLETERDRLSENWQRIVRERDELRTTLASQVDSASWLEIELESASNKLAATRDELRVAEVALEGADFTRKQLVESVRRLEQDLQTSRERGRSDRQMLEDQLALTRMQLAEAGTSVAGLRREKSRIESDFEFYGERQQERVLAMRGIEETSAAVTKISATVRNARYRALIIANYEYDFVPDLASPPHDANAFKQVLENDYGFDVEVLINLNRSQMYKALDRVRAFGEKDYVLLYYAGHGKMDSYGDGYWLPVDYRTTQPLTDTISSGDLTQTLKQSGAKHLIVVADSCYSGVLARNADPVIRKSVPALMKYWMANRSRTVLTSGGLMPVLDEGPGSHSVFANALLQVLRENTGAVNGEMLHARVYGVVQLEAGRRGYLDQKPQFAAIEEAGHENGQFVFVRPGMSAAASSGNQLAMATP